MGQKYDDRVRKRHRDDGGDMDDDLRGGGVARRESRGLTLHERRLIDEGKARLNAKGGIVLLDEAEIAAAKAREEKRVAAMEAAKVKRGPKPGDPAKSVKKRGTLGGTRAKDVFAKMNSAKSTNTKPVKETSDASFTKVSNAASTNPSVSGGDGKGADVPW